AAVCLSCGVDSGDPETERLARGSIAAAWEIHHELGPGLLPSAYEECLCHELRLRNLPFVRKHALELLYKGISLHQPDAVDLLVGERVVLNPRALQCLRPVDEAALLSQLRLGGWKLGLLINFNSPVLAEGLQRGVLSGR